MTNLTDKQSAFIQNVEKRLVIQNSYPVDMKFYPLSNKFAEGAELKTPWLASYLSHRTTFKDGSDAEFSRLLLRERGADFSDTINRFRGALLGLAIGDALGTTLEFQERDFSTVTDIVGGGVFKLNAGYWTDDTSMACCLAYSLIKSRGFNAKHLMESFSYWYRYGAFSPTGACFDVGNATRLAIEAFLSSGNPFSGNDSPSMAGNGSLMRIAPIVLFYFDHFEDVVTYAAESSKTTHPAVEAVDACRYFSALLFGALSGERKEILLSSRYSPVQGYWDKYPLSPKINSIAIGEYQTKNRDKILSTGYVVDSLEAALWAFARHDSFRAGMLEAVNLAGDSDTIGAIYGQIAGAYYGEFSLPIEWITKIYAPQGFYHFAQDLLGMRRFRGESIEE